MNTGETKDSLSLMLAKAASVWVVSVPQPPLGQIVRDTPTGPTIHILNSVTTTISVPSGGVSCLFIQVVSWGTGLCF